MIASFHVIRYRRRSAASGLARTELDGIALGRVPGLRFSRSFLSALGDRRRPRGVPLPHPTRSLLFGVWEDDGALDRFLQDSPVARRWRSRAREAWHVRLEPLGARGTWGGLDPLSGARRSANGDGPGVILSRIHLRARGQPPFWPMTDRVAAEMSRHPGFLAAVFMTEPAPPLIRNLTFSVWRSLGQAMNFAYQQPTSKHAEAMRRTEEERWHKEFYFARFRPYASSGTWEGDDPLAVINSAGAPTPASLLWSGARPWAHQGKG